MARYEQSDLTQREFAQRHGLSVATLNNWRRRQRQVEGAGATVDFQPVSLGSIWGTNAWAVEVALPEGVTVRLSASVPAPLAGQLIELLRR